MKKKVAAIIIISLTCVIGFFIIFIVSFGLDFMCYLKGYVGYCSSNKLPYILNIILGEIAITTIITCFYIYSEFFVLSKKF